MQEYTTERFIKIKPQQILCHDKIWPQYGHLSATDYLRRAFPNKIKISERSPGLLPLVWNPLYLISSQATQ